MVVNKKIYITNSFYNSLSMASRYLMLSKSTIINVFIKRFLALEKSERKEYISNHRETFLNDYNVSGSKSTAPRATILSINKTFHNGIKKFCNDNDFKYSHFIHLVLKRYSRLLIERNYMSLRSFFSTVREKKRSQYQNYYY